MVAVLCDGPETTGMVVEGKRTVPMAQPVLGLKAARSLGDS